MTPHDLLGAFEALSEAPNGIARLRELVLQLAVRGKLVPQDPNDEPVCMLLGRIAAEKARLTKDGKIPKPKPLPLVSEDERPFEVPDGWLSARLGDLGVWAIGSGFPEQYQGHEGLAYLFCKVSDMNRVGNQRFIVTTANTIDERIRDVIRANIHPAGTIIFPKIGGAIATNKRRILTRPTAIDNNCLGVIPHSHVSLDWLFLLLSSIDLAEYQSGTSLPALSQGVLSEIRIALPPLPEQHCIVAKVNALMPLLDRLEAARSKRETARNALRDAALAALRDAPDAEAVEAAWARIAERMDDLFTDPADVAPLRQTILQLAVRGKLVPQDPNDEPACVLLERTAAEKAQLVNKGKLLKSNSLPPVNEDEVRFEVPEGWVWCRFGTIADSRLGKMLDKSKNRGTPRPYLRNANVQWFHFELDDILEIRLEDHEVEEYSVLPGDLLICEGGEPGRAVICSDSVGGMAFQKALHRARPFGGVAVKYLAYLLRCDAASGYLEQYFTGATIRHFTGQALASYVIPLPPTVEQHRIVTKVDALMALCDALEARLAAAREAQAAFAAAAVHHLDV